MRLRQPWEWAAALLAGDALLILLAAAAPLPTWSGLGLLWLQVPVVFVLLVLLLHPSAGTWPLAVAWGAVAYLVLGTVWFFLGPGDDTDPGDLRLLVVWPVVGLLELGEAFGWWSGPE